VCHGGDTVATPRPQEGKVHAVELTEAERREVGRRQRPVEPEAIDVLARSPIGRHGPATASGRISPALLMQLQRTVGNASACRMLAHPVAARSAPATLTPAKAQIQRKVGRSDGVADLSAQALQTWLRNAGVWDTLSDQIQFVIEQMRQSTYQWTYGGMAVIDMVNDARELLMPKQYARGLIKGTLTRVTNSADFHVSPGDPRTLGADMLWVAEDVLDKMTQLSSWPGRPGGRVNLRPQGAAVLKILVQLLGESLGDPDHIQLAHEAIKWRKFKEKAYESTTSWLLGKPGKSDNVLEKSVFTEHAEYLTSLVGVTGVDIRPLLKKAAVSDSEFTQNMLEATEKGQDRLKAYLGEVEQATHTVSMDVYIDEFRLPEIIATLKRPPRTD
jgi:hypothetical protein